MDKRDYIRLTIATVSLVCAAICWNNHSRGFQTLCSAQMMLCSGGCEGCDTSTCSSGPCYAKSAGYYMKEGTGSTVAICSSQRTGGCNFDFEGNEYVPCHTIKFGCSDDTCTSGCSTTTDYGRAECRAL